MVVAEALGEAPLVADVRLENNNNNRIEGRTRDARATTGKTTEGAEQSNEQKIQKIKHHDRIVSIGSNRKSHFFK